MSDYATRFSGIARLYSSGGLERLRSAHVCIIGIGGVGSWAAEALARSGIGKLTLIDLDEVCITNVNRQLPALSSNVGTPKITVMEERIRGINPEATIHSLLSFFNETTAAEILATQFDYVLDAIDSVRQKALLIAHCFKRNIPIVTTGGAGGRRDPTQIQVADLAQSSHDRLLLATRTELRKYHGFSKGEKTLFGVDAVFSTEPQVFPSDNGAICVQPANRENLRLNCESGYGTATFVTGAFGFVAASVVVRKIAAEIEDQLDQASPPKSR